MDCPKWKPSCNIYKFSTNVYNNKFQHLLSLYYVSCPVLTALRLFFCLILIANLADDIILILQIRKQIHKGEVSNGLNHIDKTSPSGTYSPHKICPYKLCYPASQTQHCEHEKYLQVSFWRTWIEKWGLGKATIIPKQHEASGNSPMQRINTSDTIKVEFFGIASCEIIFSHPLNGIQNLVCYKTI